MTPVGATEAVPGEVEPPPHDPVLSFVPGWLAAAPAALAGPALAPAITPLPSAVVFADISGFSRLTQVFEDQGADGIESLTRVIDDFLGKLLDTVARWGGDVEDLYGDGILAFWAADTGKPPPAARALGCAAELVARFDRFAAAPGVTLRLRAAAVAGDCFALQLGGFSDHWLFLLAGDCLGALGTLLDAAQSGQVGLGPGMRGLAPGLPALVAARGLAAALRSIGAEPPAAPAVRALRLDPELARLFLPRPLRNRTLDGSGWLAEFRAVSVLCATFPAVRCDRTERLPVLQQMVTTVQHIVQGQDGAVFRCSMSEKGPVVMAAFGVPDCAHADDPSRALLAALQIAQAGVGHGARCTVASGIGFCGVVGNAVRRGFTPAGAAVNRAAKLLVIPGLPAVVCDEATARAADYRIELRPLDGSAEIGQDRPLLFEAALATAAGGPQIPIAVLGRERELNALLRRIDAVTATDGRSGVIAIEGEAGIGKSDLAAHVLERAATRALVLRCAADPMKGATPLAALSPLFATLYAPELATGRDAIAGAIGAVLRRRGMDPAYAGLAGAVLPLARAPDPAAPIRDLTPEDAARVQRDVLLALLRERIGEGAAMILIEEVHWLDSASWMLLNHAVRELRRVLFLLTARPELDTGWQGFDAALDLAPVEQLRLSPLGDDELAGILALALGCTRIEQRVLTAIVERARGSPLFALQLAYGLRDRGLLLVEHGTCLLDTAAGAEVLEALPDTLQRTIIARFDRLSEPLQLILKVASVFGQPFSTEALGLVTPLPALREALSSILGDLVRAGLLRAATGDRAEPGDAYDFTQPVARDVVYGLLAFAQRRALHDGVARYLEQAPGGLSPPDALLGHHLAQAGEPLAAMRCWERAGAAALGAGAYREAARAYAEAVQAAERLGVRALPQPGMAKLRQNLGEALLHSGDLAKSRSELQRALALLGRPFGHGPARAAAALGRHSSALVWREAIGRQTLPGPAGAAGDRHRQLARIYENLGQVMGHAGEPVAMATCVVAALNAAYRGGDDAAYSRAAGLLALACLLLAWPRTADRYYAHARRARPGSERPHDRLMTAEYLAIYLLAAARLGEAEAELREMLALAAQSGNQRRGLDAASLLTLCLMEAGRHDECAELQAMLARRAEQYGDPQLRCWVALEQAQLAFAAGRYDDAERHLAMAERLLLRLGVHEAVWTFGLLAVLRARQDRLPEALGFARRVTALATGQKIAVYAQHGIFGASVVLLEAIEEARGSERSRLEGDARAAMRVLGEFGLRMPLTRPRALLLLARYARLSGRRRRAERLAARALAEAAGQGRPYPLATAFPWLAD
jgi:class 3 adenylate cyclase